jgi:acyl-coenzyme A synthetase/AMP-(fatty) acid ligase
MATAKSAVADSHSENLVADLVVRARVAQVAVAGYRQEQADLLVAAAGWAVLEPGRNRRLAELGEYNSPRCWHVVQDLPKGPSSKVQRLKLIDVLGT